MRAWWGMPWPRLPVLRAPFLLALAAVSAAPAASPAADPPDLLRRDAAGGVAVWEVVNDGVMGGRSRSRLEAEGEGGAVVFRGELSLENNGGFASVRTRPVAGDLSGWAGLELEVEGDGRTYDLNLRQDDRWDGVTWKARFATVADGRTTVRLAWDAFRPGWRGEAVPAAGAFRPARFTSLGLMLADKQAGPFALRVHGIRPWAAPAAP